MSTPVCIKRFQLVDIDDCLDFHAEVSKISITGTLLQQLRLIDAASRDIFNTQILSRSIRNQENPVTASRCSGLPSA